MIVLPMLGKSSRFFTAGYTRPKYELLVQNKPLFDWVLRSFHRYFNSETFLFLVRNDFNAEEYVKNRVKEAGIKQFSIIVFNHDTRGQADTVHLGLKHFQTNENIYIFNIDTIHFDFSIMPMNESSGYLEVFHGEGEHWSFIEPKDERQVIRTTEKERISDLCSNGLYAFKNADLFNAAFDYAEKNNTRVNGELYIAPLYNHLIEMGHLIEYKTIPVQSLGFCGTPNEYQDFLTHSHNYSFSLE